VKQIGNIINFINHHPLASRHRVKAYSNLLLWQLSQTVYPHEKQISFVNGTKLIVKKGMTGATGNIYTGLHDFEDMVFLLHLLTPGDLFFDIGANVGSYSILAGGCAGSRVIAVEPIRETFNYLQKNIRVNNLEDKITALNIGLSDHRGTLHFTTAFDTINHVLDMNEKNEERKSRHVDVDTFDELTLNNGIPVLTKIDVEGYEYKVLEGMMHTLQSDRLKAIIIELNGSGRRYGYNDEEIHQMLNLYGYYPFSYDPFKRFLTPINHFGTVNTIYIKDENFVKDRIANAHKIKIFSEEL